MFRHKVGVRAKAREVRFGRPPKLTPHQRAEARARLEAGETQADIARSYAVDATTIGRLALLKPPHSVSSSFAHAFHASQLF